MREADRKLDVRGEICPYPVIYTLRELKKMEKGQVLEVTTDHLPSVENVPAAAEKESHDILEVSKIDVGVWKIRIKVKET